MTRYSFFQLHPKNKFIFPIFFSITENIIMILQIKLIQNKHANIKKKKYHKLIIQLYNFYYYINSPYLILN
jgi:hypothetical protein